VYKAIGVNTFVGLWHPLKQSMLAQLRVHGMRLIAPQSQEALALKDRPVLGSIIQGWMSTDEPDNAQPDGSGNLKDCVSPEEIARIYDETRARDPTRPMYIGFGQAIANPAWVGRGKKCGAIPPEKYYSAASRGADIVSSAIYPAAEVNQAHVMGRLDLVGRGVRNLKSWVPPGVAVWATIETTRIHNPKRRPMPAEIRSEVWMAIINGATGIIYFVHEWQPSFEEAGVFRHRDVIAELKRLNGQIKELAPVLNAPTLKDAVSIEASGEIAHMAKQYGDTLYVFAVNMTGKPATAKLRASRGTSTSAVIVGEDRNLDLLDGTLSDTFDAYQARIYQFVLK